MKETPSRAYFRQRQRNRLYEAVVKAVEQAAASGLRKRDIAAAIERSPTQVSHWLSGPSNWTIDSVSDVLYAVGAELDFSVVPFADRRVPNRFHPMVPAADELKSITRTRTDQIRASVEMIIS